jgi:hypothetical protein
LRTPSGMRTPAPISTNDHLLDGVHLARGPAAGDAGSSCRFRASLSPIQERPATDDVREKRRTTASQEQMCSCGPHCSTRRRQPPDGRRSRVQPKRLPFYSTSRTNRSFQRAAARLALRPIGRAVAAQAHLRGPVMPTRRGWRRTVPGECGLGLTARSRPTQPQACAQYGWALAFVRDTAGSGPAEGGHMSLAYARGSHVSPVPRPPIERP